MPHQKLLDYFMGQQIAYELHTHAPFFTIEDSCAIHDAIPGAHSKNLFLRDKRKNFFLVSVLEDKRVDLKTLSKHYGAGHFSFGNPGELKELLGVIPGSVTPYGLINDTDHRVEFLLDKDFMGHELVNFHPLRNDMTVNVKLDSFFKFFEGLKKTPLIIDVPTLA